MLKNSIHKLVAGAISGDEDALKAYSVLKQAEKEIKKLIIDVEPHALEAAKPYEKTFQKDGFQFEQRNGARKWNFKGIESWVDKKEELTVIEDRAKAAFNSYQTHKPLPL